MSDDKAIDFDRSEYQSPWRTVSDDDLARFSNRQVYMGFEGGSIETAEDGAKFYIIMDEGTMRDFMDPEDQHLSFTKAIAFDTEAERAEALANTWPKDMHERMMERTRRNAQRARDAARSQEASG